MIPLSATTPIVLAREPADFRAGIDGFVARCHEHLQQGALGHAIRVYQPSRDHDPDSRLRA